MNLDQLPYPIAIASAGSLSAAAKQLGISQSALSRYLASLEHELGAPLFFSKQKRMYPTKVGKAYIRTAHQILDICNSTKTGISRIDKETTQTLRVGISHQTGITIFSEIYREFVTRYPEIKLIPIEGYANDLKNALRRNDCDMIFTSGEESPELDFYRYAQSEIVLAIPKSLDSPSLPVGTISDLSSLRNCVFVLTEAPNALQSYVESIFQSHGFVPQVAFSTPNHAMARQFIQSGVGIGFMQEYHVKALVNLRLLHLDPPTHISTGCYTKKGTSLTSEMRYLQYLWLKADKTIHSKTIWSDHLRGLILEFDPNGLSHLEEIK